MVMRISYVLDFLLDQEPEPKPIRGSCAKCGAKIRHDPRTRYPRCKGCSVFPDHGY
ncbi:hypothetical protein LCGC14_0480830 [marine sediment metagenome]|uniref:Uncharacterized protein n=1 Tax=marine sediment metagenome TaxID=412755 RepID=A0A0F9SEL4_9ZZZZ